MSSTEFHSGKLIPQPLTVTLFQTCIEIGIDNGLEYDHENQTEEEFLQNFKSFFNHSNAKRHNRDEYYIFGDKLFKVENHLYMWDEDPHFMKLYDEKDGSISFITSFYNGGTCFDEMLDDELSDHLK